MEEFKNETETNVDDPTIDTVTDSEEQEFNALVSDGEEQNQETNEETEYNGDDTFTPETVYNKIFNEGFKANGQIIKPSSLDDVITLMQKGANYEKKMKEFSPYKRISKSLKKADITNDEQLSLAIDLYKGDINAIKHILQKYNIDNYDLSPQDEEEQYTSNIGKNILNNDTIEFEEIKEEIDGKDYSKDFFKVFNTDGYGWDKQSRDTLLSDTKLLKGLQEEFEMGRFAEISNLVERERIFGRLTNMSDLDAYVHVLQRELNKETKVVKKDIDVNKELATPSRQTSTAKRGGTLSYAESIKLSDEEFLKEFNNIK